MTSSADDAGQLAFRDASRADLPQLLEIYNHYVKQSTVTFDEIPIELAAYNAKFEAIIAKELTFLVAESQGRIVGFAYASPWRPRPAYRFTVENTIYLAPDAVGHGFGTALLQELIDRCAASGVLELVAVIADEGADASVRLHRKHGFEEVGHLRAVGFKFDRWLGTIIMQKSLKPKEAN